MGDRNKIKKEKNEIKSKKSLTKLYEGGVWLICVCQLSATAACGVVAEDGLKGGTYGESRKKKA